MKTQEIPPVWTCIKQINIEDGPVMTNFSHRSHPKFQATFLSTKWILDEEEMDKWILESWELSGPKLSKVDQRHLPTKTSIRMIDHVPVDDWLKNLIESTSPN